MTILQVQMKAQVKNPKISKNPNDLLHLKLNHRQAKERKRKWRKYLNYPLKTRKLMTIIIFWDLSIVPFVENSLEKIPSNSIWGNVRKSNNWLKVDKKKLRRVQSNKRKKMKVLKKSLQFFCNFEKKNTFFRICALHPWSNLDSSRPAIDSLWQLWTHLFPRQNKGKPHKTFFVLYQGLLL